MLNKDYKTKEEGIEELKKGVNARNKMNGALYWNILEDECLQLADKLVSDGVDREIIAKIGNWGLN